MNLVVDLNNVVSVQRHGKLGRPTSRSKKEKLAKESLFIHSLRSILVTLRETGCKNLVIVQDSKGLWRRELYPLYKVTEDVDTAEDFYRDDVIAATEMLFEFFRDCTAAYTLAYTKAEADDIIGVWCRFSNTLNTIMSSDKDYLQLVDGRNKLYYPSGRTYRETDDRHYDLFLKCIRGDTSDKIRSVWSGIREKKLIKAWEDPLEMVNLMESITPSGKKFKEVYILNKSIIDLSMIPKKLEDGILNVIESYVPTRFSEMKALKWIYQNTGMNMETDIKSAIPYLRKSPIYRT